MGNVTLLKKPEPVKQAYAALDAVMQEVVLAEEETMRLICARLRKEAAGPAVEQICGILQDWGKFPANELRTRAEKL